MKRVSQTSAGASRSPFHHAFKTLHPTQLFNQIRSIWFFVFLLGVLGTAVLSIALFIHIQYDVPFRDMTRDPLDIMKLPIYFGFVSQFGIFLWAGAASFCLLPAYFLYKTGQKNSWFYFLISSGLITLYLGADDAFMFHETIVPTFQFEETYLFMVYLLFVGAWFRYFYALILKTDFLLMGISALFLGLSILLDQLQIFGFQLPGYILFEDGTKMIGIIFWMGYFFRVATAVFLSQINPTPVKK